MPESAFPDIIELATSPEYLDIRFEDGESLSVAQRAILKAIYGLPMERDERLAFLEMSEKREPRKGGYDDVALIMGRRASKTMLAALVGTYETVRLGPIIHRYLRPGQVARGVLMAQDQKAAREARGYIEGMLTTLHDKGYECLASTQGQERAVTGSLIKTCWPVEIGIYTASRRSMRGVTGLWYIGDEIAHWDTAEGSDNEDKEVIRSVLPSFATLSKLKPKKLLISSPLGKQGVLWETYEKRESNPRTLVLKAPSWLVNPSLTQDYLDEQQEKDPEAYLREFGAEFSDASTGSAYLPAKIVDQCVERGRTSLPPQTGIEYVAWIDAAFSRDRFSFGVGHRSQDGQGAMAILDHMQHWTPARKKGKDLDPDEIIGEVAQIARAYRCDKIHGDQFSEALIHASFRRHGVAFVEQVASAPEKNDAYQNLRAAMRAGAVRLPDDPVTVRDLKGLIRKETKGGHVSISAPKRRGSYDDAATVVSRLVRKLLPQVASIDIAALNRSAVPSRRAHLDWVDRDRGHDEAGMDSAYRSVWETVM